jgi:hypothetical protein
MGKNRQEENLSKGGHGICSSMTRRRATTLRGGPSEPAAVVANISEWQGVTGHNVRYVLFVRIAGVVIAFAITQVSYLH